MECPKCQFENADGMNFCGKCGAKLERLCPQCNFGNPSEYEFCGKCGYKLSLSSETATKELSFDEKLTKIQKYLPKGLTEKILSQRDRIQGERKQVTVMFCDMEDFTKLSEKLGPEDAYTIMDKVYEILIHKVHDYEGTVNEMTGDGIMALFGAPIALEDAPQRAIRSSLSIHREMAKFNDGLKQEKDNIPPIRMRIGIHTGPVVVGTLGNDLRVEFKAVGDTVNIASRIEGLAEPGTTYITEDVFNLAEGFFRFEALGERKVKGKEEPVQIYRVIAPSTRRTRFDVSAERGLTPFIGRDRQLELMLDGFERAKAGRGQVFSILSEAGVGKSRLLYEFRKAISNDDVNFFEGKCLSYSRGVAYHPIVDLFKSNFDIQGEDGDSEITLKVKKGLKTLGIDEASTLPYLQELLSVKDSGIEQIPISPDAMKEKMIETGIRIPLSGSEIRPLIMAIEDIHWIDKSSEDVLKALMDRISGAKILLIFTYRPEFMPTWGGKSYHNQLNLNPLSNRQSLVMANHLLGTEDIDRDLEELILEKTEGVPFFIEEFIKSFTDLKFIERKDKTYHLKEHSQALTIPSTIHDVLMARVDSLPEKSKGVLQAGSVIGREFDYMLIKEVTKLSERELLSCLSNLKDAELFYERGIYPQSTFIFKHALTCDTAYQSLLKSTRQKYHGTIARVLEEHFPKTAELQPELLGFHFTEADLADQAIPYWMKASEIAIRRSANIEAIGHIESGLELLNALPGAPTPERVKLELRLQIALGNALIATSGYADPEVGKTFNRARVLCLQEDDSPQLAQILHGLARFHIVRTELQKTQEMAEEFLRSAKNQHDPVLLLSAHQLIGTTLWFMGNFAPAQEQFEQGISYYDPQQHRSYLRLTGEDQGVVCLSYMARTSWMLGYPDRSLDLSSKALTLARKLSHPLSTVFALSYDASLNIYRKEPGKVQEQAKAAIAIATEQGFVFWTAFAGMFLGSALSAQGHREEGLTLISKSVTDWQATGAKLGGTLFLALLAEAYGKAENVEKGLDVVADTLALIQKNEERYGEAELYRNKGELLLMQGKDETEAENSFKQGIEISKHQRAKSLELRSTLSLIRLWQAQGKREDARRVLTEIYNWFTEGFDTADLKEARALLEVIS